MKLLASGVSYFALFISVLASTPAQAETPRLSGAVSVATEGIGRGLPVTNGDMFGALTVRADWRGFYASGTVDAFRAAGADFEGYFIAGHAASLGPFVIDTSVVRYWYPGGNGSLDFWEGAVSATASVTDWTLTVGARGSERYFLDTGHALYLYGEAGRQIAEVGGVTFAGSVLLGRQRVEQNAALGAPDWNVGKVNLSATRGVWSGALTYWETDIPASYGLDAGGRIVATLTRSF